MGTVFNVNEFENLPLDLKPSDYIDFLLFLSNLKPCVRLGYNKFDVYNKMIIWCKRYDYYYVVSSEKFMYISKKKFINIFAMKVDNSLYKHSFILGLLFGYPSCCSKKIASIGENNIDAYETSLVSNSGFPNPYHITNPNGYIRGECLISHIPCCDHCKRTLLIAQRTYSIIIKYKNHPRFARWKSKWIK